VAEKKRRDSSILRRTRESKRSTRSEETAITSNAILPTAADRDTIPADETIGIRKGPVRCEACNTDFASR
jgi:hypothetical protein